MPRKSAAVAEKPAESRRKPRAKVFPSRPVEASPVAIYEGEAYYSESKSGAWRPATVEDRKALKKGDRVSIADNNWVYTFVSWEESEALVQFIGYNFRTRIPADKLQVEGTTPKPGKFQVGDRVYHAQQTNTGVIQQLNPSEDSALVKFAHEKPVWIGVKGLSPLAPAHVLNPAELQEGDRVKGQTLQGQEYQGEFAGLSMSGMAMIKAVDDKKRMLNPETLVRLAEEPSEVEEGDRPVEPVEAKPKGRRARKTKEEPKAAPSIEPKEGDRLVGLSVTGNYHSGVFKEKTTSGLFLIQREDQTEVIITPDSARILDQLTLPSEPEQPAEFPTELALNQIRLDKGLQPRGGLDRDHVQDLTEALQRGEALPPVGIKHDGETYWLYSGFHRVEAHRMADRVSISVRIESGDYRAAKIAAAATNADHGLKRSPETKRRVVSWFLSDPEWCQWSDRQIAEATKTSHVFVGKMRRELAESGELPPNVVTFPDTRKFNRNGKTHEMAIAPRPKDPIPTVEELHALFSQIGSVEPAVKGTGFAVQNAIGAPFPLAFKNKMQAWEWWQSHTEQIARLVSGAGDYKPPLEPTPQSTEITEETRAGLAEAGLQICAPSISPEEFNTEMAKPLPEPKLPKGICNLTEISGGWRVDGLELSAAIYAKLAAIARQHTKDASMKEAIAFLVQSFELAEQPVDEEVEA